MTKPSSRIHLSNQWYFPIQKDAEELTKEILANETIKLDDGTVVFTKHILYVN